MGRTFFQVDGLKELQRSMQQLEKVPQKHITTSVKQAMSIVLKDAKAKAPEDEGYLKKGIIRVAEKTKKERKVYRLVFDKKMNNIFQKTAKSTTTMYKYRGYNRKTKDFHETSKTSYYPVSQEYGYFAKNGRYIPGFMFGHKALKNNVPKVERMIIGNLKSRIDEEIRKRGL